MCSFEENCLEEHLELLAPQDKTWEEAQLLHQEGEQGQPKWRYGWFWTEKENSLVTKISAFKIYLLFQWLYLLMAPPFFYSRHSYRGLEQCFTKYIDLQQVYLLQSEALKYLISCLFASAFSHKAVSSTKYNTEAYLCHPRYFY